jgi:hypothetical protein
MLRRTWWLLLAVVLPAAAGCGRPAETKFAPAYGCYLGAYVEKDARIGGSMTRFAQLTGKPHASYFRYVGYGRPFPADWVAEVHALGAIPSIAFEPNKGLAPVRDDAYLRDWARAAGRARGPIMLRFASEMNGDWSPYHGNPTDFVRAFRTVHDVMVAAAPNVAMVWTPFQTPVGEARDYYPGDRYVDWVGVNIYSVHHYNKRPDRPAYRADPRDQLRPIYRVWGTRRPIQISEYGAAHFCGAEQRDVTGFAVEKLRTFYLEGRRGASPLILPQAGLTSTVGGLT